MAYAPVFILHCSSKHLKINHMSHHTRRNFIKAASLGTATLGLSSFTNKIDNYATAPVTVNRHGVWVATLTQFGIKGADYKESVQNAIKQMEGILPLSPDIFCLPEIFHVAALTTDSPPLSSIAEDGSGNILGPLQAFAKKNRCYLICPVYTVEKGKFYNAAVLIDRDGKQIGQYRKAGLTAEDIQFGLTAGPLDVPIFKTDFGLIGIQICFDIEWAHGWSLLQKKGAEIVFWPSAYAGGQKVNTKAWENQYYVVSSTQKNTTKICDITGVELAASGNYSSWGVCTSINLEKAFIHSYPDASKFPAIRNKYGRKVNCYSLHEEEFSIIESLSPDVQIADVLKEFDILTYKCKMELARSKQETIRL